MSHSARFGHAHLVAAATLILSLAGSTGAALAQSGTWNANTNGNWSDTTKWSGGIVADGANNTAAFIADITATRTVSLDSPRVIGSVVFADTGTATANNWTLVDLGSPLTLSSTATPTITVVDNAATVQPVVQGTQGFTVLRAGSAGQLTLQGANTYGGITTVGSSGTSITLRIENSAALGASGASNRTVITNGSRVQFAGGITAAESFDIAGAGISGALNNGTGAANTITGLVTLTGSAQIGGGAGGKLVFERAGGGTSIDNGGNPLLFSGGGEWEVRSPIGGAGALLKAGTGTSTLAGVNTYGGTTTISGGVLNLRNSSALGSTAAGTTLTAGQLQLQGGITIGNEPLSIVGVHTGNTGALRNISGDNTYGGLVTLTGASRINSDADTLTLSGGITGSSTLSIGGTGNTLVSGPIATGTAGLAKDGTGTLILTAANTFTGDTTLNGGTLQLGNGGTGGSLAVASTVALGGSAGSTLSINQSDVVTQGVDFSGAAIGGQGGFAQIGSGTTILNAANAYKGPTTVSAGMLVINGNQAQATGTVSVSSGATLGGSGTIGGAVAVLAGGTLSPGAGVGVLTAASLSLAPSATTLAVISGTVRGSQYDGIDLTSPGGPTYGGSLRFDFQLLALVPADTTFDIFTFSGAAGGNFTSLTSTGFYAGTWSESAGLWSLPAGDQMLTFSPLTGDVTVRNSSGVPEIDPAGWCTVMALLMSGLALHERRRGGRGTFGGAAASRL